MLSACNYVERSFLAAYATTVGEGDDFKTVNKIVSNLLQRFQSPRVRLQSPRNHSEVPGPSTSNVMPEIIESHDAMEVYSSLVKNTT